MFNLFRKVYRKARQFKICMEEGKEFSVSPFLAYWYVLKGFSVNEYYCYQLNRNNYKEYLTYREGHLPHQINNFGDISANKLTFSEVFKQYVDVPINYGYITKGNICALNSSGISNENFYDFVLKEEVYIKPYNGSDGKGIVHLEGNSKQGVKLNGGRYLVRADFNDYIGSLDSVLIQKKLEQGNFAASLYPHTTNTLRIISVRDSPGEGHRIIAARQRIGCSASFPIDNFDKNGLAFEVNIEIGELGKGTSKKFLNKDGSRYFIGSHPDTGKQITGLCIPCWEEIKRKIIEITEKLPLFEFVAWDVVLQDDGKIALMEINLASGLCMFQTLGERKDSELGRFLLNIKAQRKHVVKKN